MRSQNSVKVIISFALKITKFICWFLAPSPRAPRALAIPS